MSYKTKKIERRNIALQLKYLRKNETVCSYKGVEKKKKPLEEITRTQKFERKVWTEARRNRHIMRSRKAAENGHNTIE